MLVFFFLLGVFSLLGQLVVLRELISWFGGDEIFYALGLGFWLLFVGLGSLWAKRLYRFLRLVWFLQLIFALLVPITLILLRLILSRVLPFGELPSLFEAMLITALAVLPLSILSGALFTLGCQTGYKPNLAYFWETIGFVAAGLFYTFVLSQTAFPLPSKFDCQTLKRRYPDLTKIVYSKGSQLIVAENLGQQTIFSSGNPVFNNQERFSSRQIAGLFPVFLSTPAKILTFGDLNLANELTSTLLPQESVFLSSERKLFELQKEFLDQSVKPFVSDPRRFLASANDWDLIVFSPGNPSNLLTNRYFTLEFFKVVKAKLTKKGIFTLMFYLPVDYQSEEALRFGKIIYQTINQVFPETELLMAEERVIILGSSLPIKIDPETEGEYFRWVWQDQRRKDLTARFNKGTKELNRDHWPLAYFYHHLFWQTISSFKLPKIMGRMIWFLPLALLAGLIVLNIKLSSKRRLGLIAGASSFVLMAVETLILFLFQTKIGYLYSQLGLIIAAVLLGMALGVWLGDWVERKKQWLKPALVSYLLIFIFLFIGGHWQGFIWFWLVIGIASGFIDGAVYALTNACYLAKTKDPAFIYAFDLFGGFLGALLTATCLLPGLGIVNLSGFLVVLLLLVVFCSPTRVN